jgi:hypothetical protein
VSTTPTSQSLTASRDQIITITFDESVNGFFVGPTSFSVFGHWSGVAQGSVTYMNGGTTLVFTPSTQFNAGEWVCVSLSTELRSISGDQLEKGYAWQFWIAPTHGNIELQPGDVISTRLAGEGHIQTYGAHGGDLNHDGYSDFFVPNEISNDCRVFINDGTGSYSDFTIYPIPGGSRPSTNESADFDNDGDLDIAVGNSTGDSVTVFLGDGNSGFKSIKNYLVAQGIRGLAISDMDGDGDADIVTANRAASNVTILHNDGAGRFAPPVVINANSSGETACATGDANGDGILDLFVGAHGSGEITLMLGDGEGSFVFSDKVSAGGGGTWMVATGDINKDGHADVAFVNSQAGNIGIVFSDGEGGLSDATTYATGAFPIAVDLGDIDADGDLDVMASNYAGGNWVYYENNGSGGYINRRELASSDAASCATFHDRDNDGDLDMTGIDEDDDLIFLLENTGVSALEVEEKTSINVFPNPTQSGWYVDSEDNDCLVVKVLDFHGHEVAELSGKPLNLFISAEELSPGIYFLQITDTSGVVQHTKKVCLVR